jgi:hypothetical protein
MQKRQRQQHTTVITVLALVTLGGVTQIQGILKGEVSMYCRPPVLLVCLYKSVMQIKTNIVSCQTADSKPVKQEVNGTVILPPLVFSAQIRSFLFVAKASTTVTVACCSPWVFCLKSIANGNTA